MDDEPTGSCLDRRSLKFNKRLPGLAFVLAVMRQFTMEFVYVNRSSDNARDNGGLIELKPQHNGAGGGVM